MNFKKINCPVCGLIPKWLRFIIIFAGLILFISYFGNSLKTEEFFSEDKNNQSVDLNSTGAPSVGENKKTTTVSVGGIKINAVIADTEEERTTGLSGYDSLSSGEGMLFVFQEPDIYGFWMEGMKFALDIIWVNENKEIIYVEENVLPETYPVIFQPASNATYVLEVQSGFFSKNKLKIGDKVNFLI